MSSTLVVPDSCRPPPLLWFWFLHICCYHVDQEAVGNCRGDDSVAVQALTSALFHSYWFATLLWWLFLSVVAGPSWDPAWSQLPSWSWIKDMLVFRVFGWNKGNYFFILRQNTFSLGLIEASKSSLCHHQMSLLSSPRRNASNSNWNNAETSVLNMFNCPFSYRPKFKIPISVEQTLVLTPQLLSLLC